MGVGTPITTALINAANGNTCQGAVTACCEDVEQVSSSSTIQSASQLG